MTQDMNHTIVNAFRAVLVAAMMSLAGSQAMADGVVVHGNVYGGGNLADVKTNTAVNMSTGTVEGNVFGGGKGKADNFTCDKAMVGIGVNDDGVQLVSGEGENAIYTLKPGGTTVTITNGTVEGDVYGGGEVGRVERNTIVTIGTAGENGSDPKPVVKGHVFGAGKGVETHGYSALVRGNATVTIQGKAQVWQNVHGGGEKASVGRYQVAITQALADQYHVRIGMPCYLKAGGTCTVNIQDGATIGKEANTGDVYGAGQGVTPSYNNDEDDANRSKRMVGYNQDTHKSNKEDIEWNYYVDEDGNVDDRFVWEYFTTKDDYLLYMETLGRASDTDVVIGGKRESAGTITTSSNAPTVKGTVYGGSESGFVYHGTVVNIKKGTVEGDAFGGGKGLLTYAEAGRVRINTNLTISDGTINGNVYGGGSLGDVGRINKTDKVDYNYMWTDQTDPVPNPKDPTSYNWNNTGVCNVTISGGTIGANVVLNSDGTYTKGNVFGAGKGSGETWWCEKAIAYKTNVTISAGTVNGTVYGGGQVGRVENDATVVIGTEPVSGGEGEGGGESTPATTIAPTIAGNVFGAGAGLATHGYSALVRGNSTVTVQGTAQVGGSVYGGGETASVGRFTVVGGLPKEPQYGGVCIVNVKDNAKIGTSGTTHNVYGACKGVTPAYSASGDNRSKSMQLLRNAPENTALWSHYNNDENSPFIWRYYASETDYFDFLETLALTSHPHVTIGGTWTPNETTGSITVSGTPTVYGSVYGGGERGLTLGNVDVNIIGGTVEKDVYGGGALANTNAGNWDKDGYTEVTGLTAGTSSVTGLYTKTVANGKDIYTEITNANETAASGTTYYSKGKWADATLMAAKYSTSVDLTGGLVKGDAYGGGLGQKTGFNSATKNIEATVWGDIDVTLNGTAFDITYDTTTDQETDDDGNPVMDGENPVYVKVVKSGRVFGCNNLLGSPQGDVTVTVWKTVAGNSSRTSGTFTDDDGQQIDKRKSKKDSDHSYELAAVYGGGNLAPYEAMGKKAHVIINGCGDTSILTVYGGGNAADVPETAVDVNSCYEIGALFGGGNGKDKYKNDSGWKFNPGADVNGNANTLIYGGTVHEAYGGSNEKGTIFGAVTIDIADSGLSTSDPDYCKLDVAQLVGAGKNADVNGDLKIIMGCKPTETIPLVFGGADNANVNGDVELTITSGNFTKVFGGNNNGGCIKGHIKLNIEETTCIPLNIEHLYLCGNNAAYSQYGYYVKTTENTGENATGKGATNEHAILSNVGKLQLIPRESADDPHFPVDTYSYTVNETTGEVTATWTVLPITGDNKFGGYAPPELNVISCTSIGEVFGGGYGTGATVCGNPTVNINMIPGAHANKIDRDGTEGADDSTGNLLGAIGDVYGGGDAAAVYGNTTVNIGTATSVDVYVFNDNESGEYVLQYDGENPQMTTETVTGAYITGNVYGGGKLADVGKTRLEKDKDNKDVDVVYIAGSTSVNICAVKGTEILDDDDKPTGRYNYTSVSFAEGAPGVTILGNVYGGGKGEAIASDTEALDGAFRCSKAMVTGSTSVAIGNGTIGNGTTGGTVYGGGEKGRIQENTVVTIGCENETTSAPVINGNVFGAGQGVSTHGYSALARGNSFVTVQGEAKLKKSVYGGGEIASVGKYNVAQTTTEAQEHGVDVGMPYSLANQNSGYCTVVVRDNAVIGPDDAMLMTASGYPDDYGHVFGAGKGVLPYEGYAADKKAWRVKNTNEKQNYLSMEEAISGTSESDYLTYVETLGLASQTYVTIDENAFIKGSVYGGSENGYVQHDTQVNIQGNCQIGNGYVQMTNDGIYLDKLQTPETPMGVNRRYSDAEWTAGCLIPDETKEPTLYSLVHEKYYTSSLPECASWPYGQATGDEKYVSYDKYYGADGYNAYDGRTIADDGHTYYGNVFGGGSGSVPYRPGKWHPEAGSVAGNTVVNITGGHILTNIYGGNELTDVKGKCTVNFGGNATLGVPRTLKQIGAHPVTCYLFGAGKGDPRVLFNKATNVEDVEVNITGGTIYGSVFGGGEDGHVLRDVKMTIGTQTTTGTGSQAVTTSSGPTIGTWGTSYVDGNVFGGGRGFTGDAYTAGNVAGSVKMEIKGGSILGSIYGGGRLGSVGYGLFESTNTTNYGKMQDDETDDTGTSTQYYKQGAVGLGRGHIDITISGGTIGNDREYIIPKTGSGGNTPSSITETDFTKWSDEDWTAWKNHNNIPKTEFDTTTGRLSHAKGGNVFAGGMGNFYKQDGETPISAVDWWKLGCVKSTKLTITGGTIKGTVFGGGELGQVVGYHTAKNAANSDVNVGTEVIINGGTIGSEIQESVTTGTGESATTSNVTRFIYGSVFGGGYGSLMETLGSSNPKYIAGRVKAGTRVEMTAGEVHASVYGGGKMAAVGESKTLGESLTTGHTGDTHVIISGGTIGKAPIELSDGSLRYFGGAKVGNVYGGGSGHNNTVRSGHIYGNTNVTISGGTIYHNVYGGGAYGSVGDFDYITREDPETHTNKVFGVSGINTGHPNSGVATVTITGGTIGYDGKENGMIFGSSRGDINEPGQRDDYTAWVDYANVTIGTAGTPASGSEEGGDYVAAVPATGPAIKGSVYGSGENGHTFNNTVVTVNGGTIGIASDTDPGYTVTSNGKDYSGAAYPYRGNVYGGGCGTDKYYSDHSLENHSGGGDTFNALAGIVYGETKVYIKGGEVVRNVYGAGAMGSVGRIATETTNEVTTTTISGGLTTINVSGGTIGTSGTVGDGNVFGAARGDEDATADGLSRVFNTSVTVSGGTVKGNVYGGGELGDVGIIDKSDKTSYNYLWTNSNNSANTSCNNTITGTNNNTGICSVTVSGGTIGTGVAANADGVFSNGNVYGGSKGSSTTWWCEKAIAYATNVSVSGGTVRGTVYGGGEVGRVEDDAKVTIGVANATGETPSPMITGNVFGAGAGVKTHGYSALVRGNSDVTVQGTAQVGGSVYGGGEIASVGKFTVPGGLPKDPLNGGTCTVKIKGYAKIGESGTTHHVFGACKGVTPAYNNTVGDVNRSKSMQLKTNAPQDGNLWSPYNNDDSSLFIWRYYASEADYLAFLRTLALTSNTHVTIDGTSEVNGSVYGGGERGITLGGVDVNMVGGTVHQDIYGGGSLADSNTSMWDAAQNKLVDFVALPSLIPGTSATGYYSSQSANALITDPDATVQPGTTYYANYKTNVNLKGGTVECNVYGGGLGQLAKNGVAAVLYTAEEATAYNTEHGFSSGDEGYVSEGDVKTPAQPAVSAVEAKVFGDVLVKLNEDTSNNDCEVKGTIFGCNNLNGSPQSNVTVHVYRTVTKNRSGTVQSKPDKNTDTYEMTAVYGGGNLAAYYPDDETVRGTAIANVIIDGCDLTSIGSVYGGGNAASVPATEVVVNGTYEIGEVFGGGNGKDNYQLDDVWYKNPGANVGLKNYTHWVNSSVSSPGTEDNPYYLGENNTNPDTSTRESRSNNYGYGIGKAHATIYGGTVHKVYGGSNTRGNVRVESRTTLEDRGCDYAVDEAYGGGNNAPQDGDAVLEAGCIQGLDIAYGGASNADVNGDVILNITNGTYGRVFGGNNLGGVIRGTITVNIEETGCRPIVIGQLYGGGNLASYTVENISRSREDLNFTDPTAENYYKNFPKVNVKSFTSIGTIFGGGFGIPAELVGNPQVNVNVYEGKYYNTFKGNENVINENAKVVGTSVKYSGTGYDSGYPIPYHKKGAIGAINDVFGGGNLAKVIGNPTVNIGTEAGEEVYAAVEVATGTSVADYYVHRNAGYTAATGTAVEGTTYYQKNNETEGYTVVSVNTGDSVEGYYTYSEAGYEKASGNAVSGTTYYLKTVKAVDIRGNVFGGGNNAEVEGDTNVVIGKKITTP